MSIPANNIIESIIMHAPSSYFKGIGRIELYNNDFQNKKYASVKYSACGSKSIIKLYFDYFDDLPKKVVKHEIGITLWLGQMLLHEVFHHLRKVKNERKLDKQSEEQLIDDQAMIKMAELLKEMYSQEELSAFSEWYKTDVTESDWE